MPQVSYAKGSL